MIKPVAVALALFLVSGCNASEPPPCPFQGEADFAASAGCLVLVHGRILVVESRFGGITPPGGKSKPGESAQCAAHRETWEETGLDLRPGRLLHKFDTGFYLYACDIHADSGAIEAGSTTEVRRGFWLPVTDFDKVEWRFDGQGEALLDLIKRLQ